MRNQIGLRIELFCTEIQKNVWMESEWFYQILMYFKSINFHWGIKK